MVRLVQIPVHVSGQRPYSTRTARVQRPYSTMHPTSYVYPGPHLSIEDPTVRYDGGLHLFPEELMLGFVLLIRTPHAGGGGGADRWAAGQWGEAVGRQIDQVEVMGKGVCGLRSHGAVGWRGEVVG